MLFREISITNISKNIKDYRKRNNMSQISLSETLEMDYQNYSKMERGVYTPSLSKLESVCKPVTGSKKAEMIE